MFMNRHDVRNPQPQEPAEQDSVAAIPRGTLKPADPVTVQGGQVVRYQPEFDGATPSSTVGSLQFRFGQRSPAAAKIDPITGRR